MTVNFYLWAQKVIDFYVLERKENARAFFPFCDINTERLNSF